MKKIFLPLLILSLCALFSLSACKTETDTPDIPDTPDVPDTPDDPGTDTPENPDPVPTGPIIVVGLEVKDNGKNVIYLGQTFTGAGYEVNMVYQQANALDSENPIYTKVLIENFIIDDSKVNYRQEGTYKVTITGRDRTVVAKQEVTIRIATSVLADLGVNHVYGIKASYTGNNLAIGATDFSAIVPTVYLIKTNGTIENGELVTTEERIRSGFVLDTTQVDTTKAGTYPVYVSYTAHYNEAGGVDITVDTFILVTVA